MNIDKAHLKISTFISHAAILGLGVALFESLYDLFGMFYYCDDAFSLSSLLDSFIVYPIYYSLIALLTYPIYSKIAAKRGGMVIEVKEIK